MKTHKIHRSLLIEAINEAIRRSSFTLSEDEVLRLRTIGQQATQVYFGGMTDVDGRYECPGLAARLMNQLVFGVYFDKQFPAEIWGTCGVLEIAGK